jgi:catechol 2,3-dioxygenase-like lactoylglutathione lyase family enzyme
MPLRKRGLLCAPNRSERLQWESTSRCVWRRPAGLANDSRASENVRAMAGLGRTIPALPVRRIATAVAHFRDRLGFTPLHVDDGFAVVQRDDARVHLWQAADRSWSERGDLYERPVHSGAESFLRGDGKLPDRDGGRRCPLRRAGAMDVMHPVSRDGVTETDFGTREFATLDADGNLIEFFPWAR